MSRLLILTLVAVALAIIVFIIKNRKSATFAAGKGLVIDKAWLTTTAHPLTPAKDIRPPDQTFLTFPEWFLVFSPEEQAQYFEHHTSTTFPYWTHVRQLWGGYGVVYDQIKGNYKFNTGYHVMIMIIAVSTTVEYGLKALYENTIGRLTNPKAGAVVTEEDWFNASYMRSYVDFIKDTPWYEYKFMSQLKALWRDTSFFGPHFLRKLERKYYLTNELLVKAVYGWLIGLGTKASYDTALLNTTVVVDHLPGGLTDFPDIKNIKRLSDGGTIIDLPRYARFNSAVVKLAAAGVKFKEIAGNQEAAIMLTVLTKQNIASQAGFKHLFTQAIPTRPGWNRVALVTTVSGLSGTVNYLTQHKVAIEHIYDY